LKTIGRIEARHPGGVTPVPSGKQIAIEFLHVVVERHR
jgi:hypothetical protein